MNKFQVSHFKKKIAFPLEMLAEKDISVHEFFPTKINFKRREIILRRELFLIALSENINEVTLATVMQKSSCFGDILLSL